MICKTLPQIKSSARWYLLFPQCIQNNKSQGGEESDLKAHLEQVGMLTCKCKWHCRRSRRGRPPCNRSPSCCRGSGREPVGNWWLEQWWKIYMITLWYDTFITLEVYRTGLQMCRRILLSCFEKFPLILQLLPCSTGYRNLNTKSKQNIATLLQAHSVMRFPTFWVRNCTPWL